MKNTLICFLYDHLGVIKKNEADIKHLRRYFDVIEFFDTDHFLRLCTRLRAKSQGFILAHAGASDPSKTMISELKNLEITIPVIKDKIIYFSTGVGNQHNKSIIEINPDTPKKRTFLINEIQRSDVNLKTIQSLPYAVSKYHWSIKALENQISLDTLKTIVAETIGSDKFDYLLSVIKSGHSGAILIKIDFKDKPNGKFKSRLIKMSRDQIDLNSEQLASLKFDRESLNNKVFIRALRDNNTKNFRQVKDWYCLTYPFEKDKITLRDFLRNNFYEDVDLIEIIKEKVLGEWQEFKDLFEMEENQYANYLDNLKPITVSSEATDKEHYVGLALKPHQITSVHQTVERMKYFYGDQSLHAMIGRGDETEGKQLLSFFSKFIDGIDKEAIFKSDFVEKVAGSNLKIPTAVVHGDFHSANVMVGVKGKKVAFIDFANTNIELENKHAFSDIGKLSSDLEISVMPEQKIINDANFLTDWITFHKNWLNGETQESCYEFDRIYAINDFFLNHLTEEHAEKMGENNVLRQFHIVRLHYFLKAISYNHEIREKIIFFICASIDILEYLIKYKK